jgi:hypothetical protein
MFLKKLYSFALAVLMSVFSFAFYSAKEDSSLTQQVKQATHDKATYNSRYTEVCDLCHLIIVSVISSTYGIMFGIVGATWGGDHIVEELSEKIIAIPRCQDAGKVRAIELAFTGGIVGFGCGACFGYKIGQWVCDWFGI